MRAKNLIFFNLEKVTLSLNTTQLNQSLESKIKVQETQIQKLNDKLRVLEQQKAGYDAKMREFEGYKKKVESAMKIRGAFQVIKNAVNDVDLTN